MKSLRQLSIYGVVGISCAILDVGTMKAAMIAGLHHTIAASIGFFVSLIANYYAHSIYTFSSSVNFENFSKFISVVALNYSITIIFVVLFDYLFEMPIAGKIISLVFVSTIGFLLSKYWIFREIE